MGKPASIEESTSEYIGCKKRTRRTETSKYPEEKTSTEIAQVAASERAPSLYEIATIVRKTTWKGWAIEGDSPVFENIVVVLSVEQVGRGTRNPV